MNSDLVEIFRELDGKNSIGVSASNDSGIKWVISVGMRRLRNLQTWNGPQPSTESGLNSINPAH